MYKTILWLYSKPLLPESGGTERITSLTMKGLSECGHRCLGVLVVNTKDKTFVYNGFVVDNVYNFLNANKVDVVINQWGQLPDFLRLFLDKGGEKWHCEGGNIISCLHFDPRPYSLFYQFLMKKNKSLHDYYVMIKAKIFFKRFAREDMMRQGHVLKQVYDMSDKYVILSEGNRNYLTEAMSVSDASKIYVINNPLTFGIVSYNEIIKEKKNVILVVARMYEYHKRISLVLKTWERLCKLPRFDNWTLKIVGDGENLPDYVKYVKSHRLSRVTFEGQQNPEKYYKEAKIFLMTSKMEGWGQTITEALQYGVVPIAFDTSASFHDIISNGMNGILVKESNLTGFVKAIFILATDDMKWDKMSRCAIESVKKFKLEEITKKWENII